MTRSERARIDRGPEHGATPGPRILCLATDDADRALILELVATTSAEVIAPEPPSWARPPGWTADVVVATDLEPDSPPDSVLSAVRAVAPGAPVVFVLDDDDRGLGLLAAGGADYVLREHPNRLDPSLRRAIAQRTALEDLEGLRSRYTAVEDQIPAITYVDTFIDGMDVPSYVSPKIEPILGYTAEEWLAEREFWDRIVHPDDRAVVEEEHARTRRSREAFDAEYRVLTRDGRVVWLHDHSVPVFDASGKQRFTYGLLFDITERKSNEERLRRRDAILAAIASGAEALLRAEDPRSAIDAMLAGLGEASESQGVIVVRAIGPPGSLVVELQHVWAADGYPAARAGTVTSVAEGNRGIAEALQRGELVAGAPAEGSAAQAGGVRSQLLVPLIVGEAFWGAVWFGDYERQRDWTPTERGALTVAANTIGAAIRNHRAQEEIERGREEFRSLAENLPDVVLRFSAEGRLLYANPALAAITGIASEDLTQERARAAGIPSEMVERWRRMVHEAATSGSAVRFEGWVSSTTGSRYLDAQVIPERDASGAVQSVLALSRDITDRKRTEDALGERMKELRCLFDVTRDIQLPLDADELCRRTARNVEQGMRYPDVATAHVKIDGAGLGCATPERPHLSAAIEVDGEIRGEVGVCYVEDREFLDPEEHDLLTGIAEALGLWTQRRRALTRLNESEARFRAIFEHALDPIVIADDGGRYVDANRAACRLFGLPLDELVGRSGSEFAPSGAEFESAWAAFLESGSQSGHWTLTLPNGQVRHTEFNAVANVTPGRHLSVLRDVTARLEAERELHESYDALRRADAQRRRLMGQLVSAHEEERFRIANDIHDDSIQVMTAVGMRLAILRSRLGNDDDDDVKKLEQTVETAIKRLRHLLFELRPAALDRDGLVPALREYLDMVLSEGGPVVSLDAALEREPVGDARVLVFRLLQEALQNIRKHAHASNVEISLSSQDGGVRVGIRDDGRGFEASAAASAPPGHLGLASMRERAEMAGGWIRVESAPGDGTFVDFWVPDGASASPASAEGAPVVSRA
jgi:PAS domain S-box-containing protein